MTAGKRRQRLKRALDQHTACARFTPDGFLREASPALLACLGHEWGDLQGQHHRRLCPPEVREAPAYQAFWAALAEGRSQQGVYRHLDARGESRWLEASYLPVLDRRGRVAYVLLIGRDITARHRRLADQTAVLSALNASMAVIEFSPEGTVLAANDNFLRVVGYRREQVLGRHHRLFCTPDFQARHPDFWRELAGNRFKQGRFARLAADGRAIWLEATYNPVTDGTGRVFKVVKFATDITAEVQAEQAARQGVASARATAQQTEATAAQGLAQLEAAVASARQSASEAHHAQAMIEALAQQAARIEAMAETITRIAQQTNLLALNASVEAARAGAQGRGFGVVATEVRGLAQGTTQAAHTIAEVLAENGALIRQAEAKMEDVVAQSGDSQRRISETQTVIHDILEGAQGVASVVDRL